MPQSLTSELIDVFGNPQTGMCDYTWNDEVFAENGYGRMLFGSKSLILRYPQNKKIETGRFILLLHLDTIDDRRAVNLALEDLLGLPQETLPPAWADTVGLPLVGELRAEIEERENIKARIDKEINDRLRKIAILRYSRNFYM